MKIQKTALLLVISCIICIALAGCGSRTELAGKEYSTDAKSVSAVISASDVAMLDTFTNLQSLDLTGSTCYAEIADWAETHPNVNVIYTVTMPDGQVLDPNTESIDLSEVPAELTGESLDMLRHFRKLRSADLGVLNGRFSGTDIAELSPEVSLSGSVEVLGEQYDMNTSAFDFSAARHEDSAAILSALSCFPQVDSIDLGSDEVNDLSFDDVAAFEDTFPDAEFSYDFTLFGNTFSVNTRKVNLSQVKMDDNGEAVRAALKCMKQCDYLDMDSCGVDSEHMAAIRDEFPQIEVIWRVFFGWNYTARTNTERILASGYDYDGELRGSNPDELKYCTKVKYLDIGHNLYLENLDFCAYMPDLEILITFRSGELTDLSPLANCKKLEYLELINASGITDLSPLAGLTELKHLNIAGMPLVDDITPLYGLTNLERLWISAYNVRVPKDQVETIRSLLPNCIVDSETDNAIGGSTSVGWRIDRDERGNTVWNPRYEQLRETFDYKNAPYCYSYRAYDIYCSIPYPTPGD